MFALLLFALCTHFSTIHYETQMLVDEFVDTLRL